MQYYNLPGFWEQQSIIIPLLALYRNYPYLFNDNIKISSIYGNFKNTSWDGGRTQVIPTDMLAINIKDTTQKDIIIFQNIYNNILDIPIRFVFTNHFLQNNHCDDKYCNFILKTFEKYPNQITINSIILEKYIKEKYNNYQFISSVTKGLTRQQTIAELKNDSYTQVCLQFQYNKDKNFLFSEIPEQLRHKCELIINTTCPLICNSSKAHNDADSYANLYNIKPIYNFSCPKIIEQGTAILSPNELNEYEKYGYINYKMLDRIFFYPLQLISAILNYLIKPQYQMFVKISLIYYYQHWDEINLENFNLKDFVIIN